MRAYGPGLKGGIVGKPAPFAIDTKGAGAGGLGLTVEGPCEAKMECQDNGDGTCAVAYLPTEPGEYAINILFAEQHIPGSPFKATVRPALDPSKVTASGPGLERAKAGEPATFTVDCTSAGDAELTIEIISDAGAKAEVHVQDNGDGTYSITYIPQFHGMYTITINIQQGAGEANSGRFFQFRYLYAKSRKTFSICGQMFGNRASHKIYSMLTLSIRIFLSYFFTIFLPFITVNN